MAKKYGYLATIGANTSGLTSALNEADTAITKTNKELNDINKALKFDPTNTELLTQKQDALNRQLEVTENKMHTLEAKRANMAQAFLNNSSWEKAYEPLNLQLTEATAKLKELKAQNEQMENDLNSGAITQTVYDEYTKQITEAKNAQKDFRKQIKELDKEFQKQGGHIDIDEYRQYKLELGRTEAQAASLKNEIEQLDNVTGKSSKEFRKAVESTKEYQQAMDKLGASSAELRSKLGGALNDIWNIALKVGTAITSAAVAAGAASVKIGSDFDASMSTVEALSRATGEELDALREKAKEMGATTSKTAKESADALGYMALAGWDTQQMLAGLEPILRASEAGNMELATTSDLVTDSMSAMGIAVDDLNHYLDVATKAQSSSNTSLEQLLNAYVVAGGSFKNFNVSLEESATLLGVLANRGIKGSEAGNALNSVLINLIGASGKSSEAMETLGVSAFDANGNFIGVTKTLEQVSASLEKLDEEQRAVLTAQLGGKTQYDTLQALLSGVNEEYDDLLVKISDSNGALEETAKIMRDNLQGDITTLKSALQDLGIEVNDQFTEAFREAVQVATQEVSKLSNAVSDGELGESLKKIAEAFAKAIEKIAEFAVDKAIPATVNFFEFIADNGALVKGLIIGIGAAFAAWKIGGIVVAAIKSINDFNNAVKAGATATKALTAALSVNPWVLLATAITAVSVGLITFALNADTANNRIRDYKKEINELNNDVKNFSETTQHSINRSEAEISVIEDKARRYEGLRVIQNRTAEQEERLKDLANDLQQYMPDSIQLIDEQTGAYNSLAGAIDGVILSMKKNAYVQAYENQITEIVTAQIEAKENLENLQKEFDAVDKRLKDKGAVKINGTIGFSNFFDAAANMDDLIAWENAKAGIDKAKQSIENYENEIENLGKKVEDVYSDFNKNQVTNAPSDGARIAAEGLAKQYEQEAKEAARVNEESLENYETALQAKVDALDKSLALRQMSEEQYYAELKKYLDENANEESELYFKQLSEYEKYAEKQTDAAKKAAEDAETERVNAIKASWDKITRMHDRGELTDEKEYKAKAQIVKKYCDENEDTWDSYYKWLYDYTKNQEQEIADARLEAWEDSSKELADTLAESYKDLKSQKEQVKKDLQSISLTETVKDKNGNEILGIKSLDAEIEKIDKFKASRDKLKETGISDSLLAEIDKMNYADGSRQLYIDELLGLSPDVLKEYYADWEMLRNKQEEFAQDAVSDQLEELNKDTKDSVKDIFGKMPETAYEEGVETARQYLQGIIDNMGGLDNAAAISSILDTANRAAIQKNPESSSIEKLIANGTLIPALTPININLNDNKFIKTTIGQLMTSGKRTGGNSFYN